MLGFTVCAAIIIMVLVMVLTIPLCYEFSFYVGTPFRFGGRCYWLGHAFAYEWSYEDGSLPKKKFYLGWQKQSTKENPETVYPADTSPPESNPTKEAWDELEEESRTSITYDDVKNTTPPKQQSTTWSERFWWWSLVINRPFFQIFLMYIGRLLYHSRIRNFSLHGNLGLSQPHETGWLSAVLYSTLPASLDQLRFNYTEEIYDFHCKVAGHLTPAILIVYSFMFLSAKPSRTLLSCWLKKRKENDHG